MWYGNESAGVYAVPSDYCLQFRNQTPIGVKEIYTLYVPGGIMPRYEVTYSQQQTITFSADEFMAFQQICSDETIMFFMDNSGLLAEKRVERSEILQHYKKYRVL